MEDKYAKNRFPILYDQKNQIASTLHQEIKLLKFGRLPGMLIVDTKGIIKYAYYSDNMHDIPKNRDVLELLRSFVVENKIHD